MASILFLRRCGSMLYDTLAVAALWMLVTALCLPFYQGHAIPPGTLWYQTLLLGTAYLYFAYCWRKGQTLGMRAWRLMITPQPLSWRTVSLRFFVAFLSALPLGLGFLWALGFKGLAWHDRVSKSQIVKKF